MEVFVVSTEPDNKDAVKAFFTRNAGAYAESYRRPTTDLARLVELLQPLPHWRVIDVAAGTGRVTAALAPLVREVVAVDLTPAMGTEFANTVRKSRLANVSFQVGDAEHLPFGDASADLVTCARAAHHFSDVGQAVWEMARVLRPGGRLGLIDMTTPDDPGGATFLNALEISRDLSHVRALGPQEWRSLLDAAGLVIEASEVQEEELPLREWLSPIPPDGDEARIVRELISTAKAEVAGMVFKERGENPVLLKRRIVLVARKDLGVGETGVES